MATDLLALDELDEVLRWDGRQGAIGLSAIDGLVASVVAGPVTVPRTRWLPLIFDNKMPKTKPNSLERRIVNTILAHFKAVEDSVRFAPENYRPQFMHNLGQVISTDWTTGFMLGVGIDQQAWSKTVLAERHGLLKPILVCNEIGQALLPDVSPQDMEQTKRSAHDHIAYSVVALYLRHHPRASRSGAGFARLQ